MPRDSYTRKEHLKFIIPSLIGIGLFMVPVPSAEEGVTIPVALFAGWLQNLLAGQLSFIMMAIIVLTAVCTIAVKLAGENALERFPFFQQLFYVPWFWTITRILGAIFAVMVFFRLGHEAVYSDATGGFLLGDLLHVLFAVFFFAGLFLPLLLNYGLLELFGTLLSKVMRPLFTLPGRASIDSLASWLGDGTIGVLLTSKQYEEGHYTKREAAVIGTTFSIVSITFTLVVVGQVNLMDMFFPFYLTVLLTGFIAALIMPRIPPLSRKEDTYIDGSSDQKDESIPEGEKALSYGYKLAVERGRKETSVAKFFKQGAQNVLDMWMGVAPVVMAFGLIALIIAEFTSFFSWIGAPFVPILEWLNVPEAEAASETLLIGFSDMFLPAIIGSSIESEMTRFIIAVLSVTQLIYMSEVGGLLLGSKVPVNFWELLVIFLERTLISLPVIILVAHLLF